MNSDGTWPDEWEPVDRDVSQKILDDAAETEDELVPEEDLLEGLVDYLPFLKVGGFYRGARPRVAVSFGCRSPRRPRKEMPMRPSAAAVRA